MTFVWPWIFLGLAPVAVAAILALFRPRRNLVVVSSLSLWAEAVNSAASSNRRNRSRASLAWWLLLAGAIAAVCAGSRPVYRSSAPIRRVAISLHPSAELGTEGIAEMRQAGKALLGRLDSNDRAELLLPEILAPQTGWTSPAEASQLLDDLSRLPVAAGRLAVVRRAEPADRTYHLAISTLDIASGPDVTKIDIPTHLSDVTIDALGAESIAPDKLQVFAALRNDGDKAVSAVFTVSDSLGSASSDLNVMIPPNSRKSVTVTVPPTEAIAVSARAGDSRSVGFLVRVKMSAASVAIVGRDDPYLRRLIKVDPTLRLVADQNEAQIVIANGVSAPPGKAALVIDPPAPPAGWRDSGSRLTSIMLSEADLSAGNTILRGVDLSAAAIRRSGSWTRGDGTGGTILISYKGAALAVGSGDNAEASLPRRVYLAFDLSENNCTLVRSEAYVVLLANIMRHLAPGSPEPETYRYRTPLQAGANPAWKPVARDETFDESALKSAGLAAPGIYRDPAGRLHAISLVGSRSAPTAAPPMQVAADAPLPEPKAADTGLELWSILLGSAGLFWLAGWSAAALRD